MHKLDELYKEFDKLDSDLDKKYSEIEEFKLIFYFKIKISR